MAEQGRTALGKLYEVPGFELLGLARVSAGEKDSERGREVAKASWKRTPGCRGTEEERVISTRRARERGGRRAYHESLEIGSPKLSHRVGNLPVFRRAKRPIHRDLFRLGLGSETIVQSRLQALDIRLSRLEVVARKLEEARSDLEEEDVRVSVFVDDHEALGGAAHAVLLVVGLAEGGEGSTIARSRRQRDVDVQALQAGVDRCILLDLRLLGRERIVCGARERRVNAMKVGRLKETRRGALESG